MLLTNHADTTFFNHLLTGSQSIVMASRNAPKRKLTTDHVIRN